MAILLRTLFHQLKNLVKKNLLGKVVTIQQEPLMKKKLLKKNIQIENEQERVIQVNS